MAKCNYCERSGFFLTVDRNGLCTGCAPAVINSINNRARVLIESQKIMNTSRNAETRLSRARVAIDCCRTLADYARKGIPTVTPDPRDLARDFEDSIRSIVAEYILELRHEANLKAATASTEAGKTAGYRKAIQKLDKISSQVVDVTGIELAIEEMKEDIIGVRFDVLEAKARAALVKKQEKRALGYFIDGLLALNESRDKESKHTARLVRARDAIQRLGGDLEAIEG